MNCNFNTISLLKRDLPRGRTGWRHPFTLQSKRKRTRRRKGSVALAPSCSDGHTRNANGSPWNYLDALPRALSQRDGAPRHDSSSPFQDTTTVCIHGTKIPSYALCHPKWARPWWGSDDGMNQCLRRKIQRFPLLWNHV